MVRQPLLLASWWLIASGSACAALVGADFDGRLADNGTDASIDAALDSSTSGDSGSPKDASSDGDAGLVGFDRGWTVWAVSGAFPSTTGELDNGMILDPTTGLIWAQQTLPEPRQWADATRSCSELRLGDFHDWRLPTRIELLSTVNYDFSPPVVIDFLPRLADPWSASEVAEDPTRAWRLGFQTGQIIDTPRTESHPVRCVRAGRISVNAPPYRFVAGTGSVFDTQTNLTWASTPISKVSFAQAKTACTMLNVNGVEGFRLPELHELYSIVDDKKRGPALDPMFAGAPSESDASSSAPVWSRTPQHNSVDGSEWILDEVNGRALAVDPTRIASARCVK